MKTNRIIALLLSVIFIFSVNVTGFAAEEEDSSFDPAMYTELISMLSKLGVIDANYYAIDSSVYVTRGEFAEVASRILGISPLKNFVADFIDVPSTHPKASYIYAMKNAGYMLGVTPNTFQPDDNIYFEQAVSVLVKLTGYNDVAAATGGYPTGYLTIATRNGILDNINTPMGVPLAKGTLLELTKNTVLCDILVPDSFGSTTSYITREGVNILSHYYKIYNGVGIVEADPVYTMGAERASVGEIIIGGTRYCKPDDLSLQQIFGRKVNFFYKTQSNVKTLVYAEVDDVKEVSFIVDPNLDYSHSNGAYTYETPDKTLTYKIGYDYTAVYNMNELYPIDKNKMLPKTGTVTLVDNDADGIYEVVIIDEFTNFIFGSYSEKNDKFIDYLDSDKVIDFSAYESYQLIASAGVDFAKPDVLEKDVLELYESADGKSLTAIVYRSGLPKNIDSMDQHYVYSGNEKYFISGDARSDVSSLYLGGEYTLYLNSKGELVYWERGDDLQYGYVIGLNPVNTGFDTTVSVKMYTTDSKVVILPLASKITNYAPSGIAVSVSHLERKAYASIFPETNYRELIGYKLNSEGEISTVYHPMIISDLDTFRNPPEYPFYRVDYHNEAIYNEANSKGVLKANSLNNKVLLKSNAPIMLVPPVSSDVKETGLRTFNSMYSVFYTAGYVAYGTDSYTGANETFGSYMFGSTYPYVSLLLYHKDLVSSPNVVANQYDVLITSIRYVYDQSTYEQKVIIEGREGGSKITLELPNDQLLKRESFVNVKYGTSTPVINANKTMIEVGDYVDFVADANGVPLAFALLFDSKNKQAVMTSGNRHADVGTITASGNGAIEVTHGDGRVSVLDISTVAKTIFEVNRTKNYEAKPQDFEVGDTVYFSGWGTGIQSVSAYKNK